MIKIGSGSPQTLNNCFLILDQWTYNFSWESIQLFFRYVQIWRNLDPGLDFGSSAVWNPRIPLMVPAHPDDSGSLQQDNACWDTSKTDFFKILHKRHNFHQQLLTFESDSNVSSCDSKKTRVLILTNWCFILGFKVFLLFYSIYNRHLCPVHKGEEIAVVAAGRRPADALILWKRR